jgi:hypothetical protein
MTDHTKKKIEEENRIPSSSRLSVMTKQTNIDVAKKLIRL